MNNNTLSFDKGQFNKLFPFYFLIDSKFNFVDCGTGLEKLCGCIIGQQFHLHAEIYRPEIKEIDYNILKSHCSQLVILTLNNPNKSRIRGQFEFLPDNNQLLFVGSPWFDSIEQLNSSSLSFNNLAHHDPLIDLLHVLKNQEIANDDLKHLLIKLKDQKKELDKVSEENKLIALFPMQIPDPLLRIRVNGDIIMKNPVAEELREYHYKGVSYSSEGFWKYFSRKGDYINDRFTFEISSNNKTYSFICRYLPDQNYFNVYGRDVTKQIKNEKELKRLSLVASANENGVLFNNAKGEILWANNSFCKMLGYSLNEVIGKKILDFCTGGLTDEHIITRIFQSIGKVDSFSEELIHYRKDGTWFWARIKGQCYNSGDQKELEYFSTVEDISKEKDKEEQLEILSQIAENNINGVVITDKEGFITWVNKSFILLTGYSLAESINKKPGHLLQGPETDPETIHYLKEQINLGLPFNTEILNYNKNGEKYWLRIQGQPIFNNNGEFSGFFALEENITEEKEIRKQIKESEARFRLVLEKIGDNVWELDLKSGKALFSKPYSNFGSHSTNTTIDGEPLWWDNVYKSDLAIVKESFAKYLSGEVDSQNIEYRIINQDGTIKWVLDRGVVIEKSGEGKPVRLIGTHTDITNIKLIETELEQRVKQFKSLSENIPGIIYEYEFRPDGTEGLRYVSPAVERIFGIKQSDFYNFTDFLLPEDSLRIQEKNKHCKNTLEPFYDESVLIIPGGKLKWHAVHSSFSYITQNGSIVFTGFMMDITERKNIEENLRGNEEKYRSIIANMNLGLLEVDIDDRITFANQSFCEMSSYTMDELLGKRAFELFLNEDSLKIGVAKSENRKKGLSDAYELEVQDKNGKRKWWLISGAPRLNDKHELVGTIGIHLDITDQKKLEEELIAAREKAENLARTKEIFLANMSHEIRTPMNAIMGMANQLLKTNLNQHQKFFLEIINSSSENLLVIINDILDLSKIEAGKLSFEQIGFDLKTVSKRAIQVLAHKAEEKGLSLAISQFDNDISPILIGDPYRLNQILLNLIGNAIKFTETGTVDLNFKLLEDSENAQLIQIDVIDSGIGMDQSFVDHIFDKFSQEFESTSRKYGGTGLGMSISKELVDLMGGNIFAESTKGEGSTISIKINFKKGAIDDVPKKNEVKFSPDFLSGKKILITDDNELNRLIASIILQGYGAEIIEASNGNQALELLKKEHIDIVLMDIQMPGINGYDTTNLIRANGFKCPVIALTAEALHGEREKCLNAGMNDYITKPFKEEIFLNVINNWIIINEKQTIKGARMENEKLFDLSALVEISRGNTAFVKKMVDLFCDQSPQMINEMQTAFALQDYATVTSIAHKIKPSIDNLNIKKLSHIIREIEKIGKEDPENSQLSFLLKETDDIMNTVVAQMREEYPI